MADNADGFAALLARARAGDERAIADLIAIYEPHIRRVIRMRLGPQLRRILDTTDILQSVHADLAQALTAGRFELLDSRQLVQLAAAIAQNKVLGQAEHWNRQRRGLDHEVPLDPRADGASPHPSAHQPSASELAIAREIGEALEAQATPIERQVIALRRDGLDNKEIARRLDKTPAAIRMILVRLHDRVLAPDGGQPR